MEYPPQHPRKPLFVLAASYSCVTPFVTAGVTLLLVTLLLKDYPTLTRQTYGDILLIPFWILVSSLVSGIVSLFGMARHGVRPILLKALIGIVASLGLGFADLLLLASSTIAG